MKGEKLSNKTILITGGTGSWGQELTRQLFQQYDPKEVRIFSRGEHKQVEMKRLFQNSRIRYFIGDVRDKERLRVASQGVDVIIHLAALKHVPVCEENPWEAVKTNILGTQHIIDIAQEQGVSLVVDVSTDKAVDPHNLYGVTKACGEKLMIAANLTSSRTRFVCVRGGNVLGTMGSVVPLFIEQIRRANEITLTDPSMSRFFMRLSEAIGLVLTAVEKSVGGEIFVMKMPGCKISDLADTLISKLGDKKTIVKNIGMRPGEKMSEILVSKYETSRTYDYGKYYVIVPQIPLPTTKKYYINKKLPKISLKEYDSENTFQLTKVQLLELLTKDGWFDSNNNSPYDYLKSIKKKDLLQFFASEGWSPPKP